MTAKELPSYFLSADENLTLLFRGMKTEKDRMLERDYREVRRISQEAMLRMLYLHLLPIINQSFQIDPGPHPVSHSTSNSLYSVFNLTPYYSNPDNMHGPSAFSTSSGLIINWVKSDHPTDTHSLAVTLTDYSKNIRKKKFSQIIPYPSPNTLTRLNPFRRLGTDHNHPRGYKNLIFEIRHRSVHTPYFRDFVFPDFNHLELITRRQWAEDPELSRLNQDLISLIAQGRS